MHRTTQTPDPRRIARIAGLSYLVIIVAGIGGEMALRAPLWAQGDAEATLANLLAAPGLLRASILSDTAMAVADIMLAVLLFVLFRPVDGVLSLMAMVFRLVQAAILGMNLGHLAVLAGALPGGVAAEAALGAFEAHAIGYDLGLVFFGINCLLTGWLICHSGFLPRLLGAMISASGLVYLAGSFTRVLAPDLVSLVEPAYLLPLVAETGFMLWLLFGRIGSREAGLSRA